MDLGFPFSFPLSPYNPNIYPNTTPMGHIIPGSSTNQGSPRNPHIHESCMGRLLWVELGGYGQTLFRTVPKSHLPKHGVAKLQQHSNSMKQHHKSSEPAIPPPPAVGKTGQEVHFHVGKTCGDHATIGGHMWLIDATPIFCTPG